MAAPSINENSPISSFTHADNLSNEVRALIGYNKWGEQGLGTGASIYYSFLTSQSQAGFGSGYSSSSTSSATSSSESIRVNPVYFSDVQMDAARNAFQQWSNVANLDFIEVEVETSTAIGDIRFANFEYIKGPSNYTPDYAFAYLPDSDDKSGRIGDIWFNSGEPYNSEAEYVSGAYGSHVLLHEIGHALGLEHPFDGGHTLPSTLDHYQFSVMSYSDIAGNYNDSASTVFYPTTPMLLDIQAIQYLYGANLSHHLEDNTYIYGQTYAYETIWDAGGTDTIKSTSSVTSVINLNAGEFSGIGPSVKSQHDYPSFFQSNIGIAYDVTIENAIGGSANDIIYGNQVSNVIDGGEGNDTFIISLKKSDITSIIQLDDGAVLLSSEQEQDKLINIEKVNFSDVELYLDVLISEAVSAPEFVLVQNEVTSPLQASVYEGPVSYLQFEHLGSEQSESLIAADTNDFINLLAGDDAAQGGGGNDVLDGGTGSNFLTGGYGTDIFFIDGRGFQTTWSTITDFQQGDQINIWGWIEGLSKILRIEEEGGTDGYQGATLHMDLNGNNSIDTSVTFTGLDTSSLDERQNLVLSDGTGYLYISA